VADDGIKTDVSLRKDFGVAGKPSPVLTVKLTPEGVAELLKNLNDLESITKNSKIQGNGTTKTFLDTKTGLPMAELDVASGKLALYMSTKDLANRIDSFMVSEKSLNQKIEKFRETKTASYSPNQLDSEPLVQTDFAMA